MQESKLREVHRADKEAAVSIGESHSVRFTLGRHCATRTNFILGFDFGFIFPKAFKERSSPNSRTTTSKFFCYGKKIYDNDGSSSIFVTHYISSSIEESIQKSKTQSSRT